MKLGDDLREAIAAELGACEERVHALIGAATTLTEREVVAIGNRIAELNREALGNLETLTRLSSKFEPGAGHGDTSLDGAIRGQTVALQTFVSSLNQGLSRQSEATAGVVDVARKIQGFVAGTAVVTLDLRMLTLNAKLEAARWGTQGAAFATVAAGMRDLTTEVQRVNDQIGGLADSLTALATRIVDSERSMQGLAGRLAEDVSQRLDDLRTAYEDTRSSTAIAVTAGTERAHRIVNLSTSMLTNLQFQDRMAQTLGEAEAVVTRTRGIMDDVVVRLTSAGDEELDVQSALEQARAQAGAGVLRISEESELTSSDMAMCSGVVEMF